MSDKLIIRVRTGGAECRSAERLLVLKAEAIEGVQAAAFDPKTNELIAFADPDRVDREDLLAVVVAAGLAPAADRATGAFTTPRIAEPGGYYVP